MGRFAAAPWEKYMLYTFCFIVWLINAVAFSAEGGGMLGDSVRSMEMSFQKVLFLVLEISVQVSGTSIFAVFPLASILCPDNLRSLVSYSVSMPGGTGVACERPFHRQQRS